ncbi:uncharacterized protein LOC116413367 [Galleria mellonella]|uniref:Uncharacterized protein LOC116413367 n=1 Tax=Galleria mellonella TaxID=7137 RepID=A0A6J3CA53_GALME|nr:uncharacterized protein LOC116413367 [Galleria mellonella]
MRTLIFVLLVLVVAWMGSTSPIDPKRQLINRPKVDIYHRQRRSPQDVKGGSRNAVKGGHTPPTIHPRKGEYVCGDKMCKLKPGEVPKNCNGVCQYRVA